MNLSPPLVHPFSLLNSNHRGVPVKNHPPPEESPAPGSTMGDRFHLRSTLLTAVLAVLSLLPHSLLGNPGEEGKAGRSSPLLQRVKRGWVWNQFFVLEEYTGLEPLYIGKVSTDHTHVHVLACGPQRRQLFCMTFLLWLSNERCSASTGKRRLELL